VTHHDSSTTGGSDHDGANLRLLWPQWQGAGTSSVEAFAPEFPLDVAHRGRPGRDVRRTVSKNATASKPRRSSSSN
jgi:hypothetical protein